MTLILYTLTLEKTHDIAMLKLMGARNRIIVGSDFAAGALARRARLRAGDLASGIGCYPLFPRRVVITAPDFWFLAVAVLGISVFASLLGIWKAMRISPNTVLS